MLGTPCWIRHIDLNSLMSPEGNAEHAIPGQVQMLLKNEKGRKAPY